MLLAIRDLIKEGKVSTNDFDVEVIHSLIFNKNNEKKIMLIREDYAKFKALTDERLLFDEESNACCIICCNNKFSRGIRSLSHIQDLKTFQRPSGPIYFISLD